MKLKTDCSLIDDIKLGVKLFYTFPSNYSDTHKTVEEKDDN